MAAGADGQVHFAYTASPFVDDPSGFMADLHQPIPAAEQVYASLDAETGAVSHQLHFGMEDVRLAWMDGFFAASTASVLDARPARGARTRTRDPAMAVNSVRCTDKRSRFEDAIGRIRLLWSICCRMGAKLTDLWTN